MNINNHLRKIAGVLAIIALMGTVTIVGCGKKNKKINPTDAGSPVEGDWVVIRESQDAENLNPITGTDASSSEIDGYMYETLINTDPFDLSDVPWLCDSLPKESADHLTYEFNIRKNAKYSDGQPVTGKDFIFYLKAIKNPLVQNAAPLRSYYTKVKSVELIDNDPYRIRVTMAEPYFLGLQWAGGLYALPQHIWDPKGLCDKITFDELNKGQTTNPAIKEFADFFQDVEKGRKKEFLVASGPYMFESWARNEKIVLVRNPNYWNKDHKYGKAYPDKLVWRTITDENAAVVSLKSGDIDVMPAMAKINYTKERPNFTNNGLDSAVYDYPSYSYFGYNLDRDLFKDKLVRQALSHAIDRDNIIKNFYFGYAKAIQSPLFYQRPECDQSLPIIKYDLDLAKKMLADAGWKDSDGDGTLDKMINGKKTDFKFTIMLSQGNPVAPSIVASFIESLKNIGIKAESSTLEWSTMLKRTREGDFDVMLGGWAMGVQEGDLRQIWHSSEAKTGGSNHVHFRNAEVDKLIDQISSEFDQSKRFELSKQIQKIIYEEQPYLFMLTPKATGAYSARFQNVKWFAPRPCYSAAWWWVPKSVQVHKTAEKAVATN